jgi:hypothetical protein
VAPGARWIACRNMEQGVGTPATYAECFEFFLAPYPLGGDPLVTVDPIWPRTSSTTRGAARPAKVARPTRYRA